MTENSPLAMADPILVPLVGPQVNEFDDSAPEATAAVDGLAVFFVDPRDRAPHIVFASLGLRELVGRRIDQLYGHTADVLFGPASGDEWSAVAAALLPGQVTRIDLSESAGGETSPQSDNDDASVEEAARETVRIEVERRSRRSSAGDPSPVDAGAAAIHQSFVDLANGDGSVVATHATYSVIPSTTPGAPYVIVQFRDLSKRSAERLLADKAAVTGSLDQGNELGRLCHQICSQVEEALGRGHRCALALTGPNSNRLETVVSGGMSIEVADLAFAALLETDELISRAVRVDSLPEELSQEYAENGFTSVWFVPLLSLGTTLRGAVLVASSKTRPDTAAKRVLDHHVGLLTAAIDHTRAESAIAHHALHDSLTHLPNRALIVDRLGQALARLERDGVAMSVLLVDIDRFRSVNDSRGLEVGDQVLVEVADRLLSAVRVGDTVGRVASDQYLVICVATNGEIDAAAVGERVLKLLDTPIPIGCGDDIRVTASIGAVVVDEPGQSPTTVMSQAESALELATGEGRGQFAMYEAGHRQTMMARHELEQDLDKGIHNGELLLHYQPIVEVRTGFMTGVEALVRWDRPGHGVLSPGVFIPVAEECDLVVPIGEWVIEKVCEDLARWPKSRGRSPMVSINLGARHLELDTLVPTVISALGRHNLSPPRLGFEITESMEIGNLAAATVNLRRLASHGCRIAIDDFGIGHATLDYLRRFSMAHVLKIDRSFVAGLGHSREDTAIVNASIALADSLGMQVIAEGVEQEAQLTELHKLGCRFAQGFAFARAVPFEDALELWADGRLYAPPSDGQLTLPVDPVHEPDAIPSRARRTLQTGK